jgi:hypothetical protein
LPEKFQAEEGMAKVLFQDVRQQSSHDALLDEEAEGRRHNMTGPVFAPRPKRKLFSRKAIDLSVLMAEPRVSLMTLILGMATAFVAGMVIR